MTLPEASLNSYSVSRLGRRPQRMMSRVWSCNREVTHEGRYGRGRVPWSARSRFMNVDRVVEGGVQVC
jgi:hypothetical protein